jgi:hypothetical protein
MRSVIEHPLDVVVAIRRHARQGNAVGVGACTSFVDQ